jgi:tRNA 2-thiouridine synthesizing protein A
MGNRITLDVRGLSCPQPALLVRQTLGSVTDGEVQVLFDSATARDNVRRIACHAGWKVQEEQDLEGLRLVLTK